MMIYKSGDMCILDGEKVQLIEFDSVSHLAKVKNQSNKTKWVRLDKLKPFLESNDG